MKVPEPLPAELHLKPSRLKWFLVLALGALFLPVGVMMVRDGETMGWLVSVFGALLVLVAVPQMMGWGSYLHLGPEGFEQSILFRKSFVRWDEASNFGVWGVAGNRFVSFSMESQRDTASGKLSEGLIGATSSLGDTFGMKAAELAVLMAQFQERAIRVRREPGKVQ